jgi:hypothetical protein
LIDFVFCGRSMPQLGDPSALPAVPTVANALPSGSTIVATIDVAAGGA